MAAPKPQPAQKAPDGVLVPRLNASGYWRVDFTVHGPDGLPVRRTARAKTPTDCLAKAQRQIDDATAHGRLATERTMPLSSWLSVWLDRSLSGGTITANTWSSYESLCRNHITPALGAVRLCDLDVDAVSRFLLGERQPGQKPVSPAMRKHLHRVLRAALSEACRQGLVERNVASLVRVKVPDEPEVEPLTVAEIGAILRAASTSRNAARWGIALLLGLRQSEVLGLCWADIDLDAATLRVRRQMTRNQWRHGCGSPDTCPGRDGHPAKCPERWKAETLTATKSRAGQRTLSLPDMLVDMLRAHRTEQAKQRMRLGTAWPQTDLVFTTGLGTPIGHRNDVRAWHRLLAKAGVGEHRLHDARHTAATLLLMAGVSPRMAMDLMGWSTPAMAQRYQHPVDALRADASQRVSAIVFGA